MSSRLAKIAILFRGDREARDNAMAVDGRLYPVFEALSDLGFEAEPAVYADEMASEVHDQLLAVDGVLVWADPIRGNEDRRILDALLRQVSASGVFVSTHPDAILKMGTKEVLYRTRELSWGTDTHLYETLGEFEKQFPARLAEGRPRVIKQHHGNGGIGVWKVEIVGEARPGPSPSPADDAMVRVQHAAPRDDVTEDLPLSSFIARCAAYFIDSGRIVDQAFVKRLADGMIRAYLVKEEIVGFARQRVADPSVDRTAPAPDKLFGIPSAKTMFGPSEPEFQRLRASLESDWVPGLKRLVDIDEERLPLLWDCDFLYGPKTASGEDTYVLCEINVSSVLPFPDTVPARLAEAVRSRLTSKDRV